MVAVETATGAVLFSQFRCGEEGRGWCRGEHLCFEMAGSRDGVRNAASCEAYGGAAGPCSMRPGPHKISQPGGPRPLPRRSPGTRCCGASWRRACCSCPLRGPGALLTPPRPHPPPAGLPGRRGGASGARVRGGRGRYAAPDAGRAVAEFYGEDRAGAGPGEDLDGRADEVHGNEVGKAGRWITSPRGMRRRGGRAGALPPLALRALAHALDSALSTWRVLRWGAGFQQLNTQAELALSPNTLRCGGGRNVGVLGGVRGVRCRLCLRSLGSWSLAPCFGGKETRPARAKQSPATGHCGLHSPPFPHLGPTPPGSWTCWYAEQQHRPGEGQPALAAQPPRAAFGARRLRHWVSHPLRIAAAITARLDAVQPLREDGGDDGASRGFFGGWREPLSLM